MMPSQVVGERIRRATAADLDAVVAIERVSFSDPPWSRSSFAALLDDPQVQFLVTTVRDGVQDPGSGVRGLAPDSGAVPVTGSGDGIAGYAVTWVVFDQGDLSNLAVDPGLRRRGIGRRLLEAAIDSARAAGAYALFLEVRESNAVALRLYASRGFSRVGRRRRYYRQPAEDALVLRLDLTGAAGASSRAAP
jgi:[ribosomal protein S18]-alanine N-acetyltransferase